MNENKPNKEKGLLAKIKNMSLFMKIMIGFVLGTIVGLIMQEDATMFAFMGTILINLLQMIVAPLVFFVIVGAIANIGDSSKVGRIGLKTVGWFLGTTLFAIVIGLFFANILNIGAGVDIPLPEEAAAATEAAEGFSVMDTIVNIVPVSIFEALAENDLLQIIFFGLLLGFSILKMEKIEIRFFHLLPLVKM